MIYMDQKGGAETKTSYRGGGGSKCTKNSGVSRARHRGFHRGCWGEGGHESFLLGGDQAPLSHVSVFENKNRTGNSMSVWWLVAPLPPIAIPKSFHSVPSICRAILVNIPSLKKEEESREKKNKRKPKLQPYTARTHDDHDDVRATGMRLQRSASMSQVIAIL